ncbi:MAG: adenylate/guanylate cyclase domain-containing protein [Deltaproteobacteria bacterium]
MGLKSFRLEDSTVYFILAVAASLIILFAYWQRPWFLTIVNMKATDAMFAARGSVTPPDDVVVVAIDEKSVNELGRWPWPRKKIARLVDSLKEADVVAIDIVFSEDEGAEGDRVLSDAIKDAGNIVMGYFFRDDSTQDADPLALAQIKRSKIGLISTVNDEADPFSIPFPGQIFTGIETNIPELGDGALGFGAFNAMPQDDGVYRTAHLTYGYGSQIYPALSIEALRRYLQEDIILTLAAYGMDNLTIGDNVIPVDEDGRFSLNFYGPGGSFKTISATDMINGRVDTEVLKGRLVFVGVTEKAVYDIRPTPVDSLYPGVEIHATLAANVLYKWYLIHDARVKAFDLIVLVLLPLLLATVVSRVHSTFVSLVVFIGLFFILVAGDFALFLFYNIKPGVVYPALSLGLSYLSIEAYRNFVVEKKSRYLKKAFSTYVSSQLVTELLRNPGSLKLGGEKREVTLLFSDIRGFTTLSEKLPPQELVRLLNEYLNPMTAIVLNEEGMLDKYIGDAIMAVFNAPVPIDDHPGKACNTALKMMAKLAELNSVWKERGYPVLDIGIGINTGEAVVGNMGAELRFDYTAIGDTVNLASRLEGLNKLYGTNIIVSENTYELIKGQFLFRELDLVKVKGKQRPIVMYELLGGAQADAGPDFISRFSDALRLFRSGRFEEAKGAFIAFLEAYPGDGPSRLYIKRSDEYISNPPPEDWDGIYVAKTK